MKLAIIKYNAGNIQSMLFALQRLGVEPILTDEISVIESADKVIFPGVGEAGSTMRYLRNKGLDKVIPQLRQPFFGVCLGLQLMCSHSKERDTACLNIFEQQVRLFINNGLDSNGDQPKVPHMGWNSIFGLENVLFRDVPENSYMYFVHSYYATKGPHTVATTKYINEYSSALHRDNFYAVQFHPEKSGKVGQRIIENFLAI